MREHEQSLILHMGVLHDNCKHLLNITARN